MKVLTDTGLQSYHEQVKEHFVAKEEGKGLSTNDFSDEYKKIVDDLNYTKIAVNTMTATNSSNEIGATVTETTVSWTLNKIPKTLKIKFGDEAEETLETSATSKSYTGKSITANTTIKLTATDERDATATKSATIGFQPKIYWGTADSKEAYTSEDILALEGSALASSKSKTFTVNADAGKHILFVSPSSFGTPSFNVGGFDGGFTKAGTVSHQNAQGYEQNYDVWKSVQPGLGRTTVKVS
ncbi:MAG TPA: hypothetical protein IAA06_13240 [Candidatus Blautia faecavium]|uniref:Uncharacterized protein n=1 Tax=Candidatus Blautia faecavium TaxID=2838487 RepID=A0A9D2LV15_9FIRM|nr:hypothetical protein [Candidatus Blautia faecavium]